jgi:hypothetical protein
MFLRIYEWKGENKIYKEKITVKQCQLYIFEGESKLQYNMPV